MDNYEPYEKKEERLHALAKSLEPYFFGYKAEKNHLINSAGMTLAFLDGYSGSKVAGFGARGSHSIGCSFTKGAERIAKDIKRRLLPAYRDDFMSTVAAKREAEANAAHERAKLEALADVGGGEVWDKYGYDALHVACRSLNLTIEKSIYSPKRDSKYVDCYQIKVNTDYSGAMNLIRFVKNKLLPG